MLLGTAVTELGDVNGDGVDDFAVGAPSADPTSGANNENEGAAYIILGRPDGAPAFPTGISPSSSDGARYVEVAGIAPGDRLGRAVAGGGDINGDGLNDIVFDAPYVDDVEGGANTGAAYVIFGQTSFRRNVFADNLDGTDGFAIRGARSSDFTGISVNILGDVNGDGFDDVGIGAHFFDSLPLGRIGAYHVVFGKADGFDPVVDVTLLDGDDGFRIEGATAGGEVGRYSGTSAGDINGDGFDDILVSTRFANGAADSYVGEAFIVFGHKALGSVTRIGTDQSQTQNGGVGDDLIMGNDGDDTLIGHEGNDTVFGGAGRDLIIAGAGENTTDGGSGFDTMDFYGLSGASIGITVDLFNETVELGDGSRQSVVSIKKTDRNNGSDNLLGDERNNDLRGRGGDDEMRGSGGNDGLRGGDGDDFIIGQADKDDINGGNGNDTLDGGSENDRLFGSIGDDSLVGAELKMFCAATRTTIIWMAATVTTT